MAHDEQIMCVLNEGTGIYALLPVDQGEMFESLDGAKLSLIRSSLEGKHATVSAGTYKQIITYVMIIARDHEGNSYVLAYERLNGVTDERMREFISIGFGGHVQWQEGRTAEAMINNALLTELEEEIDLPRLDLNNLAFEGEIHDDTTPLGRDHYGLAYSYYMGEFDFLPNVKTREKDKMRLFWLPVTNIDNLKDRLESWSVLTKAALAEWNT